MMPLTAELPKPMASLHGTTLIAHGIATLRRSVERVHITVGYKGALLGRHVLDLGVDTVLNTRDQGNAWWLYHTLLATLDEPLVVLTCDNVIDLDFGLLAQDYASRGKPACMVVPVTPVAGLDGDYIYHEQQVVTALDRRRPSSIYCSGIQILHPRRVVELTQPVDSFYEVWDQLIALRELHCSTVYPKRWYAVDTVAHLEQVPASLLAPSLERPPLTNESSDLAL
jgi:NDP-sugar pyrophosphorylase family protein